MYKCYIFDYNANLIHRNTDKDWQYTRIKLYWLLSGARWWQVRGHPDRQIFLFCNEKLWCKCELAPEIWCKFLVQVFGLSFSYISQCDVWEVLNYTARWQHVRADGVLTMIPFQLQ